MPITKVLCHLTDCLYFNKPAAQGEAARGVCDCSHPEKPHYMENVVCPLYKKQWSSEKHADLAKRFDKRKRFG